MRAELDQRVDPLLAREPEIEGDIGVARRERQVVIVALARRRVAAVRLHRDDELAEAHEAEPERAVDQRGIVRGLAPGGANRRAECRRARGELGLVFGERQRRLERPFGQGRDQRRRVAIRGDVVARRAQDLGDGDGARRRVEADRIAGAAAARRIVGQDAGEALFGRCGLRRSRAQAAARSATKATRSASGAMRRRRRIPLRRRAAPAP